MRTFASILFVVAVAGVMVFGQPVLAMPLTDMDNKGNIRWPDGTTITVYVPGDPDGLGRDAALKTGILKWNDVQALKDKNIKFDVKSGSPPPDAKNVVTVKWVTALSSGGSGFGYTLNEYTSFSTSNTSTGATVEIKRDTTNVNAQMATNLGIHEGGHVLGLDDVKTAGPAMYPNFTKNDTLSIGESDKKELDAVLKANAASTSATVTPSVSLTGSLYTYAYTLNWQGGGSLALFQVDIGNARIDSWSAATGWTLDTFTTGNDVALVETQASPSERFISFKLADDISYLSADHPTLSGFSFTTGRAPGTGEYFLNGLSFTQAPNPVAEPSTAALLLSALGALAGIKRVAKCRGPWRNGLRLGICRVRGVR